MEIYNNLEEQVDALCEIMKGEDIKNLVETDCINLFKAVVLKDKSAIVDMTKITTEFLFHRPTMIFWEKMHIGENAHWCLTPLRKCYKWIKIESC